MLLRETCFHQISVREGRRQGAEFKEQINKKIHK